MNEEIKLEGIETEAPKAPLSEAIDGIASSKGLPRELVVEAFKDAMKKALIRSLGSKDQGDLPDPEVEVNIDEETGFVSMAEVLEIRKDDDIEDDFLQISPEDAKEDVSEKIEILEENYRTLKKKEVDLRRNTKTLIEILRAEKKGIKVGKKYHRYCLLDEVSRLVATAVKSNLKLRINEAERNALYDIYKDHIGEIVTGTVDRVDDRSISVNIGRTVVELTKKTRAGDENYRIGDPIKVYIQEVKDANESVDGKKKGPQIEVTRASEGFLKKLFEEEIHEIYDGIVIIKRIAREAGIRSKVAVYTTNEDIDPTGACIGPGGTRIQKIVSEISGKNSKDSEKIDIIAYNEYEPLFIADSLRPATVVGIAIDSDEVDEATGKKSATAIVKDDQYSLAIGKRGANTRLASRLTGYNIDVIEESIAKEDGIEYKDYATLEREAEAFKAEKEHAARMAEYEARKADSERRKAEALKANEANEIAPAPKKEETPVASVEEKKEAKPVEPVKEVKVTTSLEALEQELAESKKKKEEPKKSSSKGGKNAKRPRNIDEDEVKRVVTPEDIAPAKGMDFYTQEEIDKMDQEDEEILNEPDYMDDDFDYDDYDDYYEDDK